MRPVDWGHVSIVLEWVSILLATPELLGGSRLKAIAGLLPRIGVLISLIPAVLTLGPFQTKPPSELEAQADKVWGDIRKYWNQSAMRSLLFAFFLPGLALAAAVLFVPWPWKWIPIAMYIVGHVNLSLMLHKKYYLLKLFRVPIAGFFVGFVIGVPVMFATVFSFSVASCVSLPFGLLGIGMMKVADETKLQRSLFIAGVLGFTCAKIMQFLLVK